jgi:xylulokinase
MNSSGLSLQWVRSVLGLGNLAYDEVVAMAETVPAGANGVVFLPYLVGERAPIWDPKARGVFFGLSLATDPGTLIRSVLEGVGYAFASNIEIIEKDYGSLGCLKLGGGGAKSALWCQILSDITGKELAVLGNPDLETLGCALIAAFGTGHYSSLDETADSSAEAVSIISPRDDQYALYSRGLRTYQQLYSDLRARFEEQ